MNCPRRANRSSDADALPRLPARHARRRRAGRRFHGLAPRATGLAWVAVALVALQVMLCQLLGLLDGVESMSPFWHLAAVPVEDFVVVPFMLLLRVTAVLVAAGVCECSPRDAVSR